MCCQAGNNGLIDGRWRVEGGGEAGSRARWTASGVVFTDAAYPTISPPSPRHERLRVVACRPSSRRPPPPRLVAGRYGGHQLASARADRGPPSSLTHIITRTAAHILPALICPDARQAGVSRTGGLMFGLVYSTVTPPSTHTRIYRDTLFPTRQLRHPRIH